MRVTRKTRREVFIRAVVLACALAGARPAAAQLDQWGFMALEVPGIGDRVTSLCKPVCRRQTGNAATHNPNVHRYDLNLGPAGTGELRMACRRPSKTNRAATR